MGVPMLNLAAWIDRRKSDVGPYADHIIHSVRAYEDRITALEDENKRLLGLLLRYRNETPLGHQPHMIAQEVDEALKEIARKE